MLGSRFDAAFPWLELAATLYKLATAIKVSAKVRREVEHLSDLLRDVAHATKHLSPDAVALFRQFSDPQATNGIEPVNVRKLRRSPLGAYAAR